MNCFDPVAGGGELRLALPIITAATITITVIAARIAPINVIGGELGCGAVLLVLGLFREDEALDLALLVFFDFLFLEEAMS